MFQFSKGDMWNRHFDKIVCINLVERHDKREYVKNVFQKMQATVDFFNADKHPKGGRYGCFHSHMSVIADAYQQGVERLLVFEDDIMLSPSYNNNNILQEVFHFLDDPKQDWDYLQLGHVPVADETMRFLPYVAAQQVDGYSHILKFVGIATHAYCLNREGMKKVLTSDWRDNISDMHFDIFLKQINGLKAFSVVPVLFEQKFCLGSDNAVRTAQEYITRKFSCTAETTNLLHNITLMKYTLHTYYMVIFITCILLMCAVIIMFVLNR